MRGGSVLREALLNVRSGVTAAGLFALLLGLAVGALAGADALSVSSALHAARQFQQSGGSTLIYDAPGRIDGAACDALGGLSGVRAAGAMLSTEKIEPAAMAGSRIPAYLVSGGFGGFTALGGAVPADGSLISADVAETLGAAKGDIIALRSGSVTVGGVYDYAEDGRRPGYGYAVLLPVPSNRLFDQCWVEAWPQIDEVERLLPLTIDPRARVETGQPAASIHQLNGSLGARYDGASRFDQRVTRFAPLAAAVAAGLLGFVAVRRRRLQLASARHAGVGPAPLLLQSLVETAVWTLAGGAVAATAVVVLLMLTSPGDAGPVLPVGLRTVAGAGATLLGATTATLSIRERHLFDYFKGR